jgi:hypothetical protein
MTLSYTPNKKIGKPANGDTGWDTPVNNDWDYIDAAFGGRHTVTVTAASGTTNLTIDEARNLTLLFTGTLTANLVYTIPAPASGVDAIVGGYWVADCTNVSQGVGGPYTITLQPISGGGSTLALPVGYATGVYTDGTNVLRTDTAPPAANTVNTAAIQNGAVTYAKLDSAAISTVSEFRSATASKLLTADVPWTAAGYVTLSDSSTIAVDFSAGFNFQVTISANRTLGNPTNVKAGQSGLILVTQDAVGGRTLSYGSSYKFANGTPPTLSTSANAVNALFYYAVTSSFIIVNGIRGVA